MFVGALAASTVGASLYHSIFSPYDYVSLQNEEALNFRQILSYPVALSTGYMGYTAKSYFQKDKEDLDKRRVDIMVAGSILVASIIYGTVSYGSERASSDREGLSPFS